MVKVATASEMQTIDRNTIEQYCIAGIVLMERAGLSVVRRIREILWDDPLVSCISEKKRIIILCGGGNNGGDGFVIARVLHNQGINVDVFMMVKPRDLKGDARINYDAARKFGVRVHSYHAFLSLRPGTVPAISLIVDALLGTGLTRDVKTPVADVIHEVNRMSVPVLAVDVPSGISSDTGEIMGCAVKAAYTVTFGLPKRGHLLYPGAEYSGRLFIEDIGFPEKLLSSDRMKVHLVQKNDAASLLPARPGYSHKGSFGHVLIVAGSRGKTGAALMAARACLRSGAGLVTIGVPESLVRTFQARVTEEMVLPLPDKGNGTLSAGSIDNILSFIKRKADVLAVGPGLSVDTEISKLVCLLVSTSEVPVVLDADALNALQGKKNILKKAKAPLLLTPHPGEMARLLAKRDFKTQKTNSSHRRMDLDRVTVAMLFAKETKTYLVLKGVPTVTATPDGYGFINSSGNAGMATAGTGDVLTGIIAAFLAQKVNPRDAATLGVYLHGFIGDIVASKKGQYSLIASDIIKALPGGFALLKNGDICRTAKH